jgi:UrcA family protein
MTARSLIASLATALTVLPSGTAMAAPAHLAANESVTFSYADLDITSPAGREMLDRRIKGAAKRVCGTPPQQNLSMIWAVKRCHEQVVSSAHLQVERALETRLAGASGNKKARGAI